jgi:hypothetical protein
MRPLPQLLAGLCASVALGLLAVVAVDAPEAGTGPDCRPAEDARREAVVARDAKPTRHDLETRIAQACD